MTRTQWIASAWIALAVLTGATVTATSTGCSKPAESPDNASAAGDSACTKDTDCTGDRICTRGACVDPGGGPTPVKPAMKK